MNKDTVEHIFFDLDHTLWDFEKNSEETLTHLFHKYGIGDGNVALQDFLSAYRKANFELWELYNFSKVTKEEIRDRRFPMTFTTIGLDPTTTPPTIGQEYLEICPRKPNLIPGTRELLSSLEGKYTMHILSNGFDATQAVKLETTGIGQYFSTVVTSESCGHKKPSAEIFDFALQQAGASKENSIMIGDNPITDIKGAKEYGLPTIYFGTETTVADIEIDNLLLILEHL
ncbi:noncanonical pyrimidine nucleotidase, YjjG family [Flammeovirga pectinis]|uniref:Noncanonical pyrimidine nucleotidase, YjjG family n=1 Tax=Flammeovirga pectinis TaxID=2494373 RepID=A0A3Q9FMR5_9BACT|nr:YjjG family noncanonical pyrimidine nucleotidase [Flammeovirga pectinis]AZQ60746.1 noncanonical pyrimidine nucleotidase, YjjG family [Flammeovirga pectinis]